MSEAKKLIVNEINKCDFSTKEPFDKISCDELPFPFSKKKLLISYKYIKRKGESKEEIITSLKNYAIIRLEQTDNISTVATVKSFSKRKKFSLVDGLNIAVTFGFSAMFILTFYLMFDERPFFFFNIFLPIINRVGFSFVIGVEAGLTHLEE